MCYEPLPELTPQQVEAALGRTEPDELGMTVIAAALNWDADDAEALCLRLAKHEDPTVRGNAVLRLGHLARRFGSLSARSIATVEAAQSDRASYVRGQAEAAWDDVCSFVRP